MPKSGRGGGKVSAIIAMLEVVACRLVFGDVDFLIEAVVPDVAIKALRRTVPERSAMTATRPVHSTPTGCGSFSLP